MTSRLWQAGLLVLGLGAGCAGSSSHQEPDDGRPGSRSDAGNDSSAGANAVDASTAAPAGDSNGGARTDLGAGGGAGSGDAGIDVGSTGGASAGGTGASVGGAKASAGAAGMGAGGTGPNAGGAAQEFGGSAGAPGTPDLTLPPGCRPQSPEETENLCRLVVDCDTSPSVRTYCHRLDSGHWECQCANHENLYQVDTAGLQACALVAELCSEPELELGEENCERTNESSDPDGCRSEVACRRPTGLETSTEAQAWLVRFGGAYCQRDHTGERFRCICQGDGATGDYTLLADDSDLACAPLVDFCMSGATPEFVGEEACVLNYVTSDSEWCDRSEQCGPQMPLTDDVSLVELEQRYASCTSLETGGSECYCSEHDSEFSFQLPTPADDASCEASIRMCDPQSR